MPGPMSDDDLVVRLRARDERAFSEVVRAWSPTMLRVARAHVSTDASAGEVVQETWLAVVRGLAGFEGRSSVKTWVFRILVNLAKTRGVKEQRSRPFSSLLPEDELPAVDPDRFDDRGAWSFGPGTWSPESEALRGEVRQLLAAAIDALPERQRAVISLRDVEGLSSEEVCALLDVSPENQRVLLHRARAKVRGALEAYHRSQDAP